MITSRRADERGHANHGWLDSWHSFSFADYRDPEHVHWGPLRVINEDRIQPGQGFGTHGHQDMEIISYVLEGALGHKDSTGTASTIVPGEVQRMTAGTGVTHSEYNHSATGVTHFLQIWLIPDQLGLPPGYEQKRYDPAEERGRLRLIGSPDGQGGSITIHQDARVYAGVFEAAEHAQLPLAGKRLGYVHMVRGRAEVNGRRIGAGDALLYENEAQIDIRKGEAAEVLVFDLPPDRE
ncbi:MAG: pirin family protein [Rhodanobacteraceae bacterium]